MKTLIEVQELFDKKVRRARIADLFRDDDGKVVDNLVVFKGNFATAMVDIPGYKGLGSAKRCPDDPENDDIGELIALSRAIDDIMDQVTLDHDAEVDALDRERERQDFWISLEAEEQRLRDEEDVPF
jgi:hypothetical protein